MELLQDIWPHVSGHPYIFLFLGMIVGGETFLLPAVYLGLQGGINFGMVILLSALATCISDTAWYMIGRSFPLSRILEWRAFSKKRDASLKAFSAFQKHSHKLLFVSKFVYGTRTLAQILAGSVRMTFVKYSLINLSGIACHLLAISFLAYASKESLASFNEMPYNEYVSILVFIVVIIILHVCLKKWLGKNFTASSSQPGTKSER